jgi:phosphopantothenoylcysteine decarboxylase/phosphopantothenate--cysteine ligase
MSESKISSRNLTSKKILFQMTGSIAAYKACQLISDLTKAGNEIQVVASESLFHFIGSSTLEGLTGRPVLVDMYLQF